MKIAVYANEIAQMGNCGVKTYSLEIIRHLLAIDGENEYFLHAQKDISQEIISDRAKFMVYGSKKKFWAFSAFGPRVIQDSPDAVFIPIQIFPFFIFRNNKPKIIVTVHDVAFLLFPDQFTYFKRKLLEFHTRRTVNFADKIIVPSEATKKDILHFYRIKEDKIAVIPHGFSKNLVKIAKNRDESVIRATNGCPYILFVGSIQPRKNIVRLADAFALIKKDEKLKDLKLVICGGKGWMHEEIYARISENPYNKDIVLAGSVNDELLANYYKNAVCFVLSSLYEGFGLPVLEAMSFGLPVICGNNSSLSEIAGDAALMVDAKSVQDIATKLRTLILSESLKAELSAKSLERAKAFTWEKAARETLEVIKGA